MTTMSTTRRPTRTTTQLRTGLAISAFLGLSNIPFLFAPTDASDQNGPPMAILVLSALVGLVSVVCAVIAWRSGNRLAIRINAAALLLNALTSLPAFFVDIDAWIKVASAVGVILTVAALVLTLRREPTPYTVTD
jgi:divalent metal cation (Fe/Co/Zn/Cd) transporter